MLTWPFPVRQATRESWRPDLSFNVEEVRELLAQTQARVASVEDVVWPSRGWWLMA